MNPVVKKLAKKYALAFYDLYKKKITSSLVTRCQALASLLQEKKQLLSLLTLPVVSDDVQKTLLQALIKKAALPSFFSGLIDLLIEQKRIALLPAIFDELVQVYYDDNHIMLFAISSSHTLSQSQLKVLKQFLAVRTGDDIIYTYSVDPKLIAGVRMQSNTLLWEYSIKKSLAMMRVTFKHQQYDTC